MRDRIRSSIPAGAVGLAVIALSSFLSASCSQPEKAADPATPAVSAKPRDLTLDAAQRQKIRLA